jgi:hypothetical protein
MVVILFLTALHQLAAVEAHKAFHPMPPMQHLTVLAAALEAAVVVLTLVVAVQAVLELRAKVLQVEMVTTVQMAAAVVVLVPWALTQQPMLVAMVAQELLHLFRGRQ